MLSISAYTIDRLFTTRESEYDVDSIVRSGRFLVCGRCLLAKLMWVGLSGVASTKKYCLPHELSYEC